ncbi:Asparagine synthetase [glutamine-hydrolyzing] 1 [Poriferisphaera corsica]|uniref:asparagine synthase (glutamine-hydrolyzing) n=1 Tax=Poriferisphaera corsica TaxID=2528020 RepID=A0A517YXY7_9BACT|nr:asparagine synthase (glutamine-hydrolyzing) [Poriferisphaera corsica]QDU35081.1 Asparagine synthetase [glutamine-hydrolyzing] 1 [Poriferisphaera corsica]
MCGFLTVIGDVEKENFDLALDTIETRGPDDRGVVQYKDLTFGHRRLAVIDIEGGHQPMQSPDGRFVLVYNGEIYNFQQLREELASQGVVFETDHSDTEVLLLGLQHWGPDTLLPKLDGMFAFSVYDKQGRVLHAARDRFGIKPFYYSTHNGFISASTLAPFWKLPDFPRNINYHALREYLAVHFIPAPLTILRDVHALMPGHHLKWHHDSNELTIKPFWSIPHADPAQDLTLDELVEITDHALYESVKRQLVADVPVGVFLSGGIDSSLMVHYMTRAYKESKRTEKVKTFTMTFPFARKGYDEAKYAKQVADLLQTEHTEINAKDMTQDFFVESIQNLDQPFADSAYLPLRKLCSHMQQYVTVAIAGDGGDEIFCGYPRYLETEDMFPPTAANKLIKSLADLNLVPGSLRRRALFGKDRLIWNHTKLGPFKGTRKDMYQFLTNDSIRHADLKDTMKHWVDLAASFADPIDTDALMRADLHKYLSDDYLTKTDRASMDFSLEVRVPMLGNPVTDEVLMHRVAASGLSEDNLKPVLKKLADKYLPREVWDRPKHGFSVPIYDFMTTEWKEVTADWVDRCEQIAPFLNSKEIKRRYAKLQSGRKDSRSMIYAVITLLGWLDKHPVDA